MLKPQGVGGRKWLNMSSHGAGKERDWTDFPAEREKWPCVTLKRLALANLMEIYYKLTVENGETNWSGEACPCLFNTANSSWAGMCHLHSK